MAKAEWEIIDKNSDRLWIPEGWIVRSFKSSLGWEGGEALHQVIVKDPDHEWKIA